MSWAVVLLVFAESVELIASCLEQCLGGRAAVCKKKKDKCITAVKGEL